MSGSRVGKPHRAGGIVNEVPDSSTIGHGTSAATDPRVLELLRERGVGLEVCPTSHPPLGVHELAAVPVSALFDAGVAVALASDDPLLFGTGLAGQYEICRDLLGLSDHQLAMLAEHSIRCSAAPLRIRDELLRGVRRWREITL